MTRREIREIVFKLIFLYEFDDRETIREQTGYVLTDETSDVIADHPDLTEEDAAYISKKVMLVGDRLDEIDRTIAKHATGWRLERMSKVDLTILRLAVYEILYEEEIPQAVAINEAVELAKKYGYEKSASFVNGVLARIVRGETNE